MKGQTKRFRAVLCAGLLSFSLFIICMATYRLMLNTNLLYFAAIFGMLAAISGFLAGSSYTSKSSDITTPETDCRPLLQMRLPTVLSTIHKTVDVMIGYCAAETESGNYIFDYYTIKSISTEAPVCTELFWDQYFYLIVDELATRKEVQSIVVKPDKTVDIIIYTNYVENPELVTSPPNLGKIFLLGDNAYANISNLIRTTGLNYSDLNITAEEVQYCNECIDSKRGTLKNYTNPEVHISLEINNDKE